MQQPTTVTPPPIPAPPAAPGVTLPGASARPLTRADVEALRARQVELARQLQSAEGRRARLTRELERAGEETRPGLQQRMAVLDRRMIQLESEIADVGRQLTSAPAGLITTTAVPTAFGGLGSQQVTAISIVGTLFVLAPLAVAAARSMVRRASRPFVPPVPPEVARRLERMEQAVDAIAVEIERVSEGQRFLTRVMTESSPAALGAGVAAPVPVARPHAVGVPRNE